MGAVRVLLGQDDRPHCEMKSRFTLADTYDDILDICCTTSSNRACTGGHEECIGLFCCGKYQ